MSDEIDTRARELALSLGYVCESECGVDARCICRENVAEVADAYRAERKLAIRRCAAICAEIAVLNRPNCAQECEGAILKLLDQKEPQA